MRFFFDRSAPIAIARMAVTCGLPVNGAMASAINVLDDVHGGAGQQCMELYLEIDAADRGLAEAVLDRLLEGLVQVRTLRALGLGPAERVARAAFLDEQHLAGHLVGIVARAAGDEQWCDRDNRGRERRARQDPVPHSRDRS